MEPIAMVLIARGLLDEQERERKNRSKKKGFKAMEEAPVPVRNNTLVELCAGSAALFRLMSGQGKLVGYAGSKDGYAEAIRNTWGLPKVDRYHLNDPGPWGVIWQELVYNPRLVEVGMLELVERSPKELWDVLARGKKASDLTAAQWLCRLAGTYGGYELGGFKGKHKLRPNVDGYIPARQSLVKRIGNLEYLFFKVHVTQDYAGDLTPYQAWVYIDPPYEEATGYLSHFPRKEVIEVALRWWRTGARVAVSESVPLKPLAEQGWRTVNITNSRKGQFRKNARNTTEWLTISP